MIMQSAVWVLIISGLGSSLGEVPDLKWYCFSVLKTLKSALYQLSKILKRLHYSFHSYFFSLFGVVVVYSYLQNSWLFFSSTSYVTAYILEYFNIVSHYIFLLVLFCLIFSFLITNRKIMVLYLMSN